MDTQIKMIVKTPQQFLEAIKISQDAFFEKTHIIVKNQNFSFSESSQLADDLKYIIFSTLNNLNGCFSNSQLSAYEIGMSLDPFEKYCLVNINSNFFNNAKEINDLFCISAEMGEILYEKTKRYKNDYDKLKFFNKWLNQNFKYHKTNNIEDHSVVNLLKTKKGVCQAIAAFAAKILPYMKLNTLYISGTAKGKESWEPHAWNLVKIDGSWIHVDFTFSLNSMFLCSTRTNIERNIFEVNHKWNLNEYSIDILDSKWQQIRINNDIKIKLVLNRKICIINGVSILCDKPIYCQINGKLLIDLQFILRLMGGACEIIYDQNILNICFGDKRIIIENSLRFFDNGYFEKTILNKLCGNIICKGNELLFNI